MRNWHWVQEVDCSHPTRMEKTTSVLGVFLLVQYLATALRFIIPDNDGPFCSGNDSFQLWEVITSCDPGGVLREKYRIGRGGSNMFWSIPRWWLLKSRAVTLKASLCTLPPPPNLQGSLAMSLLWCLEERLSSFTLWLLAWVSQHRWLENDELMPEAAPRNLRATSRAGIYLHSSVSWEHLFMGTWRG